MAFIIQRTQVERNNLTVQTSMKEKDFKEKTHLASEQFFHE